MAACRKPSEWVPLSILSVPLPGCLPSLDQVSKHILTTSAFRTFIHFLPRTHCGPAIIHENTLPGMRCHGTRHAVGSLAFHWCGWVDRPSLQSEPSTSEDENADLAQVLRGRRNGSSGPSGRWMDCSMRLEQCDVRDRDFRSEKSKFHGF